MWSIINTALFGMVLASSMQTTGIKVTYVSKPGFAIVREGTRVLGITPLTIVYTPSEAWPDCFFGNEIKITWFSGAETTLRPTVCPDMDNTYIVERPSGVAGIERDIEYSQLAQEAVDRQIVNTPRPERETNRTGTAVTLPPARNRSVLNLTERPELPPEDEFFRRFDIAWVLLSYNRQGTLNLYGGDLSFATNVTDSIAIVADVAIHQTVNSGANSTITAYRFGPRFYAPPIGRATLFGEVLAGGMRFTGKESVILVGTPLTFTTQFNGFSMAAGGGMDVRIKPWFAWRAFQADYSLLHFLGNYSDGVRAGTGIVFRFGH